MEPDMEPGTDASAEERRWKPLPSMQRRILGVLVEKAKTTPDAYPLSLNALTTGCNQKSNRAPHMNLTADQVEEALEGLRYMGAVGEVQSGGRVPKYRHYLKDWLGVDGPELAVMAELMLRGAQTVGELRGRCARMAPIPDLRALTPILESLEQKDLVLSLTAEGRGQVVAHTLFKEREMEQLKAQYAGGAAPAAPAPVPSAVSSAAAPPAARTTAGAVSNEVEQEVADLKQQVSDLKDDVTKLRREVEDLWSNLR